MLLLGAGESFAPLEELITHLIGEVDKVEFVEVETALSDGAAGLIIIVGFGATDADTVTLEDETISSTNVFVEAADGKLDEIEKFAGVEFAPSGHRKAIFTEHPSETFGGSENGFLFWLGSAEAFFAVVDLTVAADGHFKFVGITHFMKYINHIATDSVVRIDKSDPFTGGKFQAGVAGGGKALIFLMDDLDPAVLFGKNITKSAAHISRAIVDEDNLEIGINLRLDGFDTALDKFGGIINWDDDRDKRKIFTVAHALLL